MKFKKVLLVLGLLIATIIFFLPVPAELGIAGKNAFVVFVISLTLWITNIIPLAMTSLLGMALIPLFGVLDINKSFSLFGNKAIFFILGALIIAAGIQKTGLGLRIAYKVIMFFGGGAKKLIAGIMITSAFLSCIMPEHAVAALLFPIIIQIARSLKLKPLESNMGKALFLAMAWGAVIGGITTYLGGARNLFAVDILEKNYHLSIGFFEWIKMSLPIPIIILTITYYIIIFRFKPEIDSSKVVQKDLEQILNKKGELTIPEKKLIFVLIMVISSWLFLSRAINISISSLLGGVVLFILDIVNWNDIAERINWGVILMYGGAIVVASSLSLSGAAGWLSEVIFSNLSINPFLFVALISLSTIMLTEGISNVAAVAIILPLTFSWGNIMEINPVIITLSVALSGGLAFCLPMGTPPNAIAYSAGYYSISDVVKIGIILNIISWLVIMLISKFYWPLIGVDWYI